jgi:hypothetical protein
LRFPPKITGLGSRLERREEAEDLVGASGVSTIVAARRASVGRVVVGIDTGVFTTGIAAAIVVSSSLRS